MTRLGIIGSGGIGRMHAEAARRAGSSVVACCDVNADVANALAVDFPGARAVTTAEDVFTSSDVDAVVICVPNFLHKDLAIQAIAAGKDVFLEKPMAMNVGECDAIIAAADASERIVQMGFVCRCAPIARVVERMIAAGRFGEIYYARACWYRQRGIPGLGGWFTTKAMSGGGVLIDLGVHLIDLVMHLSGRPEATRLSGQCTSRFGGAMKDYVYHDMWGGPPRYDGTFDVEDGAMALVRFGRTFTMEMTVMWAANTSEYTDVTILGDRGGASFELWGDRAKITLEEDGTLMEVNPVLGEEKWDEAWTEQHARFARNVRDRTPPAASMQHGRDVQAILDALYASSDAGEEVAVS